MLCVFSNGQFCYAAVPQNPKRDYKPTDEELKALCESSKFRSALNSEQSWIF